MKGKLIYRVHWLAEQGLAPKRVFLVVIPLIIFIVTEIDKTGFSHNEGMHMKNNKYNTIDVPSVSLNSVNNLSGNITGGALLTNALYRLRFCRDDVNESKTWRYI